MSEDEFDLGRLEGSAFEPFVETVFALQLGEEAHEVVLKKVEFSSPSHVASEERRAPFSLVFRFEGCVLAAGVYALSHTSGLSCDLFLSPFDGGEDWCHLEAVFN